MSRNELFQSSKDCLERSRTYRQLVIAGLKSGGILGNKIASWAGKKVCMYEQLAETFLKYSLIQ